MPWCPNCKTEYAYDETVCADCNIPLVDEVPKESTMVSFLETDKELQAKKFVKFLKYSNIEEAVYEFDKAKELFVVYVKNESMKQVKKLYKAFYSVETEQLLSTVDGKINSGTSFDELLATDSSSHSDTTSNTDSNIINIDEDDDSMDNLDESSMEDSLYDEDFNSMFDKDEIKDIYNNRNKKIEKPKIYVKKEDQYKDLMSSAVTFLIVSILGIIILILNIVGILDIFYGLIPFVVMGGLFLAFFLIGISSLKKAKVTKGQIGEENRVTIMINEWLSANVTVEQLDALTSKASTDGERYYQKIGIMKDMVNKQFGELDDSYLEHILEEYYNNNLDVDS
jgi:thiol-disulfide isomerase/thioredoxin